MQRQPRQNQEGAEGDEEMMVEEWTIALTVTLIADVSKVRQNMIRDHLIPGASGDIQG